MNSLGLPVWVEWVRALGIPAVAFIGALIAWGQFSLARAKRQDDLFDRRYSLFRGALEYLRASEVHPDPESITNWLLELEAQAELLFDHQFSQRMVQLIHSDQGELTFQIEQKLVDLFRQRMS